MTRILIADDHEVVRCGLRGLLEAQQGWSVVAEATDGHEAVGRAIEFKPDIVILDYAMPMLNGIEATRQIRTQLSNTEVLVFTMHESDALVAEFLQAGARAFILKSEPTEQLVAGVKSLANHRPYLAGQWSERLLEGFLQKQTENGSVLSPRERVIVQLIAEGNSNKEMGSILDLSAKTIETHRAAAMRKIHATSVAALVRYAVRNHLIEP